MACGRQSAQRSSNRFTQMKHYWGKIFPGHFQKQQIFWFSTFLVQRQEKSQGLFFFLTQSHHCTWPFRGIRTSQVSFYDLYSSCFFLLGLPKRNSDVRLLQRWTKSRIWIMHCKHMDITLAEGYALWSSMVSSTVSPQLDVIWGCCWSNAGTERKEERKKNRSTPQRIDCLRMVTRLFC